MTVVIIPRSPHSRHVRYATQKKSRPLRRRLRATGRCYACNTKPFFHLSLYPTTIRIAKEDERKTKQKESKETAYCYIALFTFIRQPPRWSQLLVALNTLQSNPIQSNPIQSNPIQSNPIRK